jgi:hypothetical protein
MESLVRIVLLMLEGRDLISKALKQPYMCMYMLRWGSDDSRWGVSRRSKRDMGGRRGPLDICVTSHLRAICA